jgi:hypothetical protein
VSGYKNGVRVSGSKSDIEHNNIQASPHPLTRPPVPTHGSVSTLGPRISGMMIISPGIDLPQNPVSAGGVTSTLSLDEQKRIISSLATQWKKEHGGPARRRAFRWINEQLEQQHRDFRVEIPKDCPSAPNAPAVAVYVMPGATGQLDGDQIHGFENGVVSGQHAVTNIDGTTVASDCE